MSINYCVPFKQNRDSLSGEDRTEKQKANRPPAAGKVNLGSFRKGNQAARKHGAYTTRLSPEEKDRVEQLRADFSLELGAVEPLTPFDELLIKMAAVSLVKTETATLGNASGRVLLRWHRMGMDCLRALRATRATRDKNVFRTPEQTLSAMVEKIKAIHSATPAESKELLDHGEALQNLDKCANEESGGENQE